METEAVDLRALSDVDLEVRLRSGETDLRELTKLINAVKASLTSGIIPKIVLTEVFQSSRTISGGTLVQIVYRFRLD